jgi:hypothetical protein
VRKPKKHREGAKVILNSGDEKDAKKREKRNG